MPDFAGAWRIVFEMTWLEENRITLDYVAAGVGHPPPGTRHRNMYQLTTG